MKSKKINRMILAISIFIASLMLLSVLFVKDNELNQTITFMLIAVWLVPYFYLTNKLKKNNKDQCK